MDSSNALVPVRLLQSYRNLNAGETAGFPGWEADQLIEKGIAETLESAAANEAAAKAAEQEAAATAQAQAEVAAKIALAEAEAAAKAAAEEAAAKGKKK